MADSNITRRSLIKESWLSLIRENLIEERVAVETYRKMIEFIGAKDPTTRRLLEEILEQEEEHADELSDLLPQ